MATVNHTRARLERAIRTALDTRRTIALRCIAALAHDHRLPATEARAAAALRYLGGHTNG